MKKLLLLIASSLFIALFLLAPKAHAANYAFFRSITVTSTASVASGTNVNFPMLVSSTLSSWENVGRGGKIQNLCTANNGGQEPCDLVFATSSANCNLTPLNFETESYTSSTGALVDWVNVPSVSTGTTIYACYDDAGTNTSQEHVTSTWNSNYLAVYHVAAPTGTLNLLDSTSHAFNLTNHGASSTSGKIDGGATTTATGYLTRASIGTITFPITLEGWVNPSDLSQPNEWLMSFGDGGCGPTHDIDLGDSFGGPLFNFSCGAQFGAGGLSVNTWSQEVATVAYTTAPTGTVNLYLNGAQVTLGTFNVNYSGSEGLALFMDVAGGSPSRPGGGDEFRMLNTALTPQWVTTEYFNEASTSVFYAIGSETANGTSTPATARRRMAFVITDLF